MPRMKSRLPDASPVDNGEERIRATTAATAIDRWVMFCRYYGRTRAAVLDRARVLLGLRKQDLVRSGLEVGTSPSGIGRIAPC